MTAAPFQPAPAEEQYSDLDDLPPLDNTWTDRTGAQRLIPDAAMGSQEWLEHAASYKDEQPMIIVDDEQMWLLTGVLWEGPMLLPVNPRQLADYVAPSMYAEAGRNGRYVYGRRSTLPPNDPGYQPNS